MNSSSSDSHPGPRGFIEALRRGWANVVQVFRREAALAPPKLGDQIAAWCARPGQDSIQIWEIDSGGDGLVYVRVGAGGAQIESALAQVDACLRLAESKGLRPRRVLVYRGSGAGRYDERRDFAEMAKLISAGACPWIACERISRISRDSLACETFLDYLRQTSVDLVVADLGRVITTEHDRLPWAPGSSPPSPTAMRL
jgi:hypothetical protein